MAGSGKRRYSKATFASSPLMRVAGPPEPDADLRPELADVRRWVRRKVRGAVRSARADEQVTLSSLLRDHLGVPSADRAVVEATWPRYEHVNVQAGIDAWLRDAPVTRRLVGVIGFQHHEFGLAELLAPSEQMAYGPHPGNVARVNVAAGPDGEVNACVLCGLYLVAAGDRRAAVLLRAGDRHEGLTVQVVSTDDDYALQVAAEIRELAVVNNVFRRQVLSFGGEVFGNEGTLLRFHKRPDMDVDQFILPPDTLTAVHEQVVEVARALAPSMLVVEDVDLIAEDRGMYPGQHPMLFQLLNEMDGLAEDVDVVFVLTTNRADLLEPALAARPGRVDRAVELTLPDVDARRRLFDLYRGGLDIDLGGLDDILARTDGVTASFLKELIRRAAVLAAASGAEDDPLTVSAADLDAALERLLDTRSAMTRVLLGVGDTRLPPDDLAPPAVPGLAPGRRG